MPRGRSRGRNNNNRTTDRFINESSRRDDGSFYGKNSTIMKVLLTHVHF